MSQLKDFSLHTKSILMNSVRLQEHMTLRNACIDYRDADGWCWVECDLPEASASTSKDQIPCLNRFKNTIGHMDESHITCFPLYHTDSLTDMKRVLLQYLDTCVSSRRLWALDETVQYKLADGSGARWTSTAGKVPETASRMLDKLYSVSMSPLSANTVHAAMESNYMKNDVGYKDTYLYPHNAATSVGLIGSLHDNECIDMSPGEMKNMPSHENREYKINEFMGFICAGHTSHSGEAGRVRRVACSIRVRVLSNKTLFDLDNMFESMTSTTNSTLETCEWTLFCMGVSCSISTSQLYSLVMFHRYLSAKEVTSFSVHIHSDVKLIVISVSSGTLVKHCSNGLWADNIEVHRSSRVRGSIRPKIDTTGSDATRACMSAFFSLWPYVEYNKAPRPLIASVQTPQAVCLPWCPATAAVSPCYAFNPIITTSMYRDVIDEMDNDETNISVQLPGENLMCLFLNLEYTYEDAIIVSRRYVENGGFSTYSLCSYNISKMEYIPPVGSLVCGVLSPWWKSACSPSCTHTKQEAGATVKFQVRSKPTGVVHSVTTLKTGDVNVKVRSFQQLQDGDKLSMPHGQKGIAVIVNYEDMPVAHSKKHGDMIPDMVMGMSSVVTRQTNGVLYEAAHSLTLMKDSASLPHVLDDDFLPSLEDEFTVTRGTTGKHYYTQVTDGEGKYWKELTKATMGFVRVLNQTQMSRERHQVSHLPVKKTTFRTPDGRARGGGVAWGEMEVQAASMWGLHSCNEEITNRGDKELMYMCTTCQRLGLLCTCTTDENWVFVKFHYDLITTDCVNAVTFNGSFQYKIAPAS